MPFGKNIKKTTQSFTSPETSFPEVIGYIVVIGRSSDLSLFANAFPEMIFQWPDILFATYRRDLQQRVLSGIFTRFPFHCTLPDDKMQNQFHAKIIVIFDVGLLIYVKMYAYIRFFVIIAQFFKILIKV